MTLMVNVHASGRYFILLHLTLLTTTDNKIFLKGMQVVLDPDKS